MLGVLILYLRQFARFQFHSRHIVDCIAQLNILGIPGFFVQIDAPTKGPRTSKQAPIAISIFSLCMFPNFFALSNSSKCEKRQLEMNKYITLRSPHLRQRSSFLGQQDNL